MNFFFKVLVLFFFSFEILLAKDFSNYSSFPAGHTLKVINVESNDYLSLRKLSNYKSTLLAKIPYNFKDLKVGNKKDVKSNWINIDYCDDSNKCLNGWVNPRYVEGLLKEIEINTNTLSIKYPSFLLGTKMEDDWINFSHKVLYKHEQLQDGKNGTVTKNELTDFYFSLKLYPTLELALKENHLDDFDLTDTSNPKGAVQKISNGYKIETGVEGVGYNFTIITKDARVIVFVSPYNINPIKSLQKKKPRYLLSLKEKETFEQFIIENTTVKPVIETKTVNGSTNLDSLNTAISDTQISSIQNPSIQDPVLSQETVAIIKEPTEIQVPKVEVSEPTSDKTADVRSEQEKSSGGSLPWYLIAFLFGLFTIRFIRLEKSIQKSGGGLKLPF